MSFYWLSPEPAAEYLNRADCPLFRLEGNHPRDWTLHNVSISIRRSNYSRFFIGDVSRRGKKKQKPSVLGFLFSLRIGHFINYFAHKFHSRLRPRVFFFRCFFVREKQNLRSCALRRESRHVAERFFFYSRSPRGDGENQNAFSIIVRFTGRNLCRA